MDSSGGRPSRSTWVEPPTDRLVLYRDATSSPGSVQSSDSNELPASQPAHFREKDVRMRRSPLAPNQGCEPETTSAGMTRRQHEAGRRGRGSPSSRSQSGTRAGDDDYGREQETGTTESEECIRPGRPSGGSPVYSFPWIELEAPP